MDNDQEKIEYQKVAALEKIANQINNLANAVMRVEAQLRTIAGKKP